MTGVAHSQETAPPFNAAVRLAVHLTRREIRRAHAGTALGWLWPLVRQLLQLAVLVTAFHVVLDLGVEHYPVFIFIGLVSWYWFAAGLSGAATSIYWSRHFLIQPRFPALILPVVAVAAPLVDALAALPVLLLMVELGPGLHSTAPLILVPLAVQFFLLTGLGLLIAPLSVYARDLPHLVSAGLLMLFYLTPVFYPLAKAPESVRSWLELNPIGALIEQQRVILLGGAAPDWTVLGTVLLASIAFWIVGLFVFRRLQPGFLEEL